MDNSYLEFTNVKRYNSAKDELSYALRSIYFTSVEVAYYTGFLPVKFIKNNTQLHFDSTMVLVATLTCLLMTLLCHCSRYLWKRAVEM